MIAIPVYRGPWQILVAVKHVLCSDGKRRYATITAQPDTFFSVPASVNVNGVTVSGYVTGIETLINGEYVRDMEFHAVQTGKNYQMLPN